MANSAFNKQIFLSTDGDSTYGEIGGLNDASISFGGDTLDTTTFKTASDDTVDDGARRKMYGLRDASVSFSGDFNPSASANQIQFFHEWLRNIIGDNFTNLYIKYYPLGDEGAGGNYFKFQVKLESIEVSGDVAGKEEISLSLQSTGEIEYL